MLTVEETTYLNLLPKPWKYSYSNLLVIDKSEVHVNVEILGGCDYGFMLG